MTTAGREVLAQARKVLDELEVLTARSREAKAGVGVRFGWERRRHWDRT